MLTLRRARAYALVVILIFATVYAVGILRRSGLIDGFGHVIGGDLLTPRMAARIVLDGRGAELIEIATYRWSLPSDTAPLVRLMDALERSEIDAVAFTSAAQAGNLFTIAQQVSRQDKLRQCLNRTIVASIGPVCTAALERLGVKVSLEASPPKLGAFVSAINHALSEPPHGS